jgi:hypothetical protein
VDATASVGAKRSAVGPSRFTFTFTSTSTLALALAVAVATLEALDPSRRSAPALGMVPGKWGRASTVGIEMAVSVIGCLLLGHWLDGKLGTDPWLSLVGIILGSIVGFRALISAAKTEEDEPPPPDDPPQS